jgi:hypothetical protein
MRHTVPPCAEPTVIGDKSASAAAAYLKNAVRYLLVGALSGATLVACTELARRAGGAEPTVSAGAR